MTKPVFTTLTSLHAPQYGAWRGNPEGRKPIPEQCVVVVAYDGSIFADTRQCRHLRGFGPEQAYCAWHNPERVEKRRAEREALKRMETENG